MCSILYTDYLALRIGDQGGTRKASIRREVLVNIECLSLVTKYREGRLVIK